MRTSLNNIIGAWSRKYAADFSIVTIVCLIIIIVTFIALLIWAKVWCKEPVGQLSLTILANLFTACIISIIAANLLKFAFQTERKFKIIAFNYSVNHIDDAVKEVAIAVGNALKPFRGMNYFGTLEDIKTNTELEQIASALVKDVDSGSILVVPFQGLCLAVDKVLNTNAVENQTWKMLQQYESKRTLAVSVTYDPNIFVFNAKNHGVRFFPSPPIDFQTVRNHCHAKTASPLFVLCPEIDTDPFQGANSNLRKYITRNAFERCAVYNNLTINTNPENELFLYAAVVAPNVKLVKYISSISKNTKMVHLYIPPTWVRNWPLGTQTFIGNFEDFLISEKVKVYTVLPAKMLDELKKQNSKELPDIIQYYTEQACRFACDVQKLMYEGGDVEKEWVLDALRKTAALAVSSGKDNRFQYAFSDFTYSGDVIYEGKVVEIKEEEKKLIVVG